MKVTTDFGEVWNRFLRSLGGIFVKFRTDICEA